MGASPRRWPNWPMVKSSTESVIITPEPHRGKEKRKKRVGEDTEVLKQKLTLSVLFSLCVFNLRGEKGWQQNLGSEKGNYRSCDNHWWESGTRSETDHEFILAVAVILMCLQIWVVVSNPVHWLTQAHWAANTKRAAFYRSETTQISFNML